MPRGSAQAAHKERPGGGVAELSLRADRTISCVFVDDDRFHRGQGPLLRNTRREGVALP